MFEPAFIGVYSQAVPNQIILIIIIIRSNARLFDKKYIKTLQIMLFVGLQETISKLKRCTGSIVLAHYHLRILTSI